MSASNELADLPSVSRGDLAIAARCLRAPQWLHFVAVAWLPIYPELLRTEPAALGMGVVAALVAAGLLGYAYGLNAITDRFMDRDRRKNPLIGAERVAPLVIGTIGAAAAVAVAGAVAWPWIDGRMVALSLGGATLYSAGPRLKRWPLISTAANWAIFVPVAFLVDLPSAVPGLALLVLTFFAFQTQTQLVHEVEDLAEDVASGVRTTAGWLGARPTLLLAAAIGLALVPAAALVTAPATARLAAASAGVVSTLVVLTAPAARAARTRRALRWMAVAVAAFLALLLARPV